MEDIIAGLEGKKRLLLHACCAPCSTAVIERLRPYFDITLYYYNPNIHPLEEYEKRLAALETLSEIAGVPLLSEPQRPEEFFEAARGLESEKEGGARCAACFYLRLFKTAKKAAELGYDMFSTTLTVSPHKNADEVNAAGLAAAKKTGAAYLPGDFKKKDGYKRSTELSREYGLYRQDYCGCCFSADIL